MKGVVIVCDGGKDCMSFCIFRNFLNGFSLLCTIFYFERGKFIILQVSYNKVLINNIKNKYFLKTSKKEINPFYREQFPPWNTIPCMGYNSTCTPLFSILCILDIIIELYHSWLPKLWTEHAQYT